MARVKQLTVSLENRPGALAHMAKVLADAKVNIVALLGSTAGEQGSTQVVVDNINNAKKALGAAGLSYTEGTLEQVELANKPGALAELAGRLAKKGQHRQHLCHDAEERQEGNHRARSLQGVRDEWDLVASRAPRTGTEARTCLPPSFSRFRAVPR